MTEEDSTNKNGKPKPYFAMALDPIHIGTGGYRLGRVDNTIVREPGTNIPKIPGTTIEGCARTYSYYEEKKSGDNITEACALGKKIDGKKPCGKCLVCITFGYTGSDEKPESLRGMAQFSDARILFFPVHSMLGPVWVTSPGVLNEFGIKEELSGNKIKTKLDVPNNKLNLGWLYLEKENDIINEIGDKFEEIFDKYPIKDKLVIVSDKLFSQIVNSNLEVRTSVAIDPKTGAAEKNALFTYEAIPRATVFWFEVMANDPAKFDILNSEIETKENVISEVEKGLKLFETLGVGGMSTRGFGRLKILNLGI